MPELPEVEHLRRTLQPALIGGRVLRVDLRRRDVVRNLASGPRRSPADLLVGMRIVDLVRHGKNLAIVAESGRVVCVHLGMSGQMRFLRERHLPTDIDHVHCVWSIRERAHDAGHLIFRDPRRFGGLWLYPSVDALWNERLNRLGPDALMITPASLQSSLSRTKRSIKAALLDQCVIAGVGNIYADEALFQSGIHPASRTDVLPMEQVKALTRAIKRVLRAAIKAGGSTIRDYADGNGAAGMFATVHQVYGRSGLPCVRCDRPLDRQTIAQRTTVFCRQCQHRFR